MVARLKNNTSAMDVDQILQQGLHEFLTNFVSEIDAIGETMRISYF